MANQPKRRRLKACDLSWFDVTKYDGTINWSLLDWSGRLYERAIISGMVRSGDRVELVREIVAGILQHPMRGVFNQRLSNSESKVRDFSICDALNYCRLLARPIFDDLMSEIRDWEDREETEPGIAARPRNLDLAVDQAKKERNFPKDYRVAVNVDLRASDQQLLVDFKAWLRTKRQSAGLRFAEKTVSDASTREWSTCRVLAFIDLENWCAMNNATISNSTYGHLLFPNEFDVDLAERMRKVVRTMAKKLMHPDFLASLDTQASIAERKN